MVAPGRRSIVTTLGALSLAAAAWGVSAGGGAAPAEGEWPQSRLDAAHSGSNQAETTVGPADVRLLHVAWTAKVGGWIADSVSVSDGVVFTVTLGGKVVALRSSDGKQLWTARIDDASTSAAPPAVLAGRVFAVAAGAEFESKLAAFDASTGRRLWKATVGSITGGGVMGAPTVLDETVFVHNDAVLALDTSSGRSRWSRYSECFLCAPAVAGGLVLTTDEDGQLAALDASTGRPKWRTREHGIGFYPPAVAGDRLFAGGVVSARRLRPQYVFAFSSRDGRRLWRTPVGRSPYVSTSFPAVADGRVFYQSADGRLYALRARDGGRLWSARIGPTSASPTTANGVVYTTTGTRVLAFDAASGRELWSWNIGKSYLTPVVADGTLYVGNRAGTLFAFRLGAG